MNPLHLRNWIKKYINIQTGNLIRFIPEVEKTTKISKLTHEIFSQVLRNAQVQPEKYYRDKNYPRLLECARKTLIFLVQSDNHYEQCLGYFYIQVMLKMNRLYEEWEKSDFWRQSAGFQEFVDWFLETK